jgi:hypothetical protein
MVMGSHLRLRRQQVDLQTLGYKGCATASCGVQIDCKAQRERAEHARSRLQSDKLEDEWVLDTRRETRAG